jgi:hypothetical protein
MTSGENSPLLQALSAHQVRASVVDFDHYRVYGGLSVETDYIISVLPSEKAGEAFESFKYVLFSVQRFDTAPLQCFVTLPFSHALCPFL